LGTNSLGWAVLDDITGAILDKGVVVFPEGIDAASDTLETPAAIRRAKRLGRRMKFRRKMRKWSLLRVLIEQKMCPMKLSELEAWKKDGKYPVDNAAFIAWLKSTDKTNPYADRAAAATKKVALEVLGRALYHIAQRRGFKSSRKDAGGCEDEAKDKDLGVVKGDIAALSQEIAASGCKTLGQYFAKCIEEQKDSPEKKRIRTRHTGRLEHYQVEFDAIMKMQGLADNPIRGRLYEAIFMQRPLRSQKHLVGSCPLEPQSPRAQIGHPAFEEFRMLSFVNNLSFEKIETHERMPLNAEDRAMVAEAFMKASPTMKFKDISKLFKKRFVAEGLKFHYYRDDETLPCCSVRHRLKSYFGDVAFDEQKVFDALTFFDDDGMLGRWFAKHYPTLDDSQIRRLCAVHPKEGNANYSLKAINKILPFLRKGHVLSEARLLAKLPDILPGFSESEEQIVLNLKEMEIAYRNERAAFAEDSVRRGKAPVPLMERYREYFRDRWGVLDEDWKKLYLRGDEVYQVDPGNPTRLPPVQLGMIRNPLVQRSMTTLRRLVNYLRDHDKIDGETTIRIELARGVNDYATRHAIQLWQQDREKMRAAAVAELGAKASADAIERYMLAVEQGFKCLYTGKTISLKDILSGNSFDIEHTIPRSLSGDDSQANKTLCDAKYNRETKKGMVPRDCPNFESEIYLNLAPWREKVEELEKTYNSQVGKARFMTDPVAKAQARIKALRTRFERDYWRDKLRRFEISLDRLTDSASGLSGFKKRQLVDSGIMSKHAVALLKSVYPNVFSVNGTATSFARKAWGLQGDEAKDRSDHTHHAKDAMVIAALTPTRFNAICAALKDDGAMAYRRSCDVCPEPYPGFAESVQHAAEEILIKHVVRQTTLRQSSKRTALAKAHPLASDPSKTVKHVLSRGDTVRGALHKDTFYGCIQNPEEGKKAFVVRKPLVGPLKNAEALVDKIVDPAIRAIVSDALEALKTQGIKNVDPGVIKMPSGVPINKVRILANTTNPAELRNHVMVSDKGYKTPYYVTSAEGSNFRLAIFNFNGKLSVKPDNSLDWAQNHKKSDYVPFDRQEGFVGYITPGALALTHKPGENLEGKSAHELGKRLYKVVKFGSDGRVTFRLHTEARASVVLAKDLVELGKHKAGESAIDFEHSHELLLLSPGVYLSEMIFEGIHFKMSIDGTIEFIS